MNQSLPNQISKHDRFEVRDELGRGGMSIVYLAWDRVRESQVALKTIQRVEGASLYRLKQEFRSLADLIHPNLVQLHELFVDGEECFFSMEFVDGRPFVAYVIGGNKTSSLDQPGLEDRTFEGDDLTALRWREDVRNEFKRTTSIDTSIEAASEVDSDLEPLSTEQTDATDRSAPYPLLQGSGGIMVG